MSICRSMNESIGVSVISEWGQQRANLKLLWRIHWEIIQSLVQHPLVPVLCQTLCWELSMKLREMTA